MLRSVAEEHSKPAKGPRVGSGIGRSVGKGRSDVKLAGMAGKEAVAWQH